MTSKRPLAVAVNLRFFNGDTIKNYHLTFDYYDSNFKMIDILRSSEDCNISLIFGESAIQFLTLRRQLLSEGNPVNNLKSEW